MLTLLAMADRLEDLLNLLLLPVRQDEIFKKLCLEDLATCHDVLLQQSLQNNYLPLLQPFVARFT